MYFVQSNTGEAEAYATVNGTTTDLGTIAFNSAGQISGTYVAGTGTTNVTTYDSATDLYTTVSTNGLTGVATTTTSATGTVGTTYDPTTGTPTAALGSFSLAMNPTDGASATTVSINFTGTTQYGSANGVNNLTENGYASGTLSNFSIGADGTITGNYSNGQTMVLGQIVLANFNDPNGLVNLGNNQFEATTESGVAQISTPGSTNHGSLEGGALEESNVDLTNQLVDLITAQRNYQANAQTIKTQQTVDQTLLQM
jgi:flagellar hook protein FlgE